MKEYKPIMPKAIVRFNKTELKEIVKSLEDSGAQEIGVPIEAK